MINEMTTTENKFYNSQIKERFLENYQETTKPSFRRLFFYSKYTEEALGKDLYDFNINEIELVLYDMFPTTFASSRNNVRMISIYISWAIEQGLRKSNINPLLIVDTKYYAKFVDPNIKLFLSEKQLRNIEDRCVNAQDYAIFRLIFEGVHGKELSEIRNLKKQDIDSKNLQLTLTDKDGSKRVLKVSSRAISFVEKASAETVYYKSNGTLIDSPNTKPYVDLYNNEYVFRNRMLKTDHYNAVGLDTIKQRFIQIKKLLKIPYFNPTNIKKSGMLYMAKELVKKDGDLISDHYLMIAERFKVNKKICNRLKYFITMDNIMKLYGEEFGITEESK